MMHICPDCGQRCTCNGDIDDLLVDNPEAEIACTHWRICDIEDDGWEWDDDYYDYDDGLLWYYDWGE